MATKKKTTAKRRSVSVPGYAKKKGRKRTSYKNKSIAGDVASLGLGLGILASPITSKVVSAVKGRSVAPLVSWNRDEVKKTAITVGVGMVGGKIAGNVLNKVKPVKLVVNKGKKMIRQVF